MAWKPHHVFRFFDGSLNRECASNHAINLTNAVFDHGDYLRNGKLDLIPLLIKFGCNPLRPHHCSFIADGHRFPVSRSELARIHNNGRPWTQTDARVLEWKDVANHDVWNGQVVCNATDRDKLLARADRHLRRACAEAVGDVPGKPIVVLATPDQCPPDACLRVWVGVPPPAECNGDGCDLFLEAADPKHVDSLWSAVAEFLAYLLWPGLMGALERLITLSRLRFWPWFSLTPSLNLHHPSGPAARLTDWLRESIEGSHAGNPTCYLSVHGGPPATRISEIFQAERGIQQVSEVTCQFLVERLSRVRPEPETGVLFVPWPDQGVARADDARLKALMATLERCCAKQWASWPGRVVLMLTAQDPSADEPLERGLCRDNPSFKSLDEALKGDR
jgi:hypothetical protein